MNAKNCSSALAIALALALSGTAAASETAEATATDQDAMMLETADDILSLEAQFTTAEMIAGIFSCSSNCYQHNNNHNHNGTHNHNNNNNNNNNGNETEEKLAAAYVPAGEARFLV